MLEPITIIGYLLVIVLFLVVIHFYSKSNNAAALYQDASLRLNDLTKVSTEQKESIRNMTTKMEELETLIVKKDSLIENLKEKATQQSIQFDSKSEQFTKEMSLIARKAENQEEQIQALGQQLHDTQIREKHAKEQVKEEFKPTLTKKEEKIRELQKAIDDLQKQAKTLLEDKKKIALAKGRIESILRQVDPKENQKNKIKVRRMEQLYANMKGLRELAEERNQNWEIALIKLANHVLGKSPNDPLEHDQAIGSVVGAALEKIGVRIIEDDEDYIDSMPDTEAIDNSPSESFRKSQ